MDSSRSTLKEIDELEIAQTFNCDIEDLSSNIPVKDNDLKIFCQNIRSVYSNIDDLNTTLGLSKVTPDILILTECRLNADKPVPNLKNYTAFFTTHHINQNDGVVAYIKNGVIVTNIKELKLDHASCLQIDTYNCAILGIYRSPSNTNADHFISSLNSHLESIKAYKNIILTGDININLITKDTEQNYERINRLNYLDTLSMHHLMPGHTIPTRESSCLDHYMLKLDKNKLSAQIAVLNTTVTDHSMIFLNLSSQTVNNKCQKIKTVTDFHRSLVTLAKNKLSELLFSEDPNYVIEQLINRITESLQEHTDTINVPKNKRIIKPWMTTGVLRCIRNRNKLQKKVRHDPHNEILKISYKRYRNFCNYLIKKLKRNYERNLLSKSIKNSKTLWKNIKSITYSHRTKSDNTKLLSLKLSPLESVNYTNQYFANLGKELAGDILKSLNIPNQLPRNVEKTQLNSFTLLDTDYKEVHDVLFALKSESAPGWDNIPTKFLKLAHMEVIPVICHLANLCFTHSIFPKQLKLSVVTPVFKNGDLYDVNNYRPISVLPSISKILERLINRRLISYLNKYELLSDSQYGFRSGRSTEDAVTALTTLITEQVDRGNKCVAVYLDLKKAFDTVCVPILVKKLENIGIRGGPLALFKDYLSNRTQKVKIGAYISNESNIDFGVPQGSVLGPTLFLIYINSLCELKLNNAKIFSYADDTAIVFSNKTWDKLRTDVESGLSVVTQWLQSNLLTLNAQKTNYMCYTIYNSTQPPSDFNVTLIHPDTSKNINLNKVSKIKYLGVQIDQRLSWFSQIDVLSARTRKLIWIFKNLRHVASQELLNKIYIILGQSILNYCIPIWGGAAKSKFIEIERAQRALIKVMYFKPYRFPTDMLYSQSQLLTVRKLYIIQSILKVHKKLAYNPNITKNKRRKHSVVKVKTSKTCFARNQYERRSARIYNLLNKTLNIYPMHNHECKKALTNWLQSKSYEETEGLLRDIKY